MTPEAGIGCPPFDVLARMDRKLIVSTLVAGAALAVPATAGAAAVEPVYLPGHPSCADRGYDHEIKFYPASSGTPDGGRRHRRPDGRPGRRLLATASKPIGAVIVSGESSSNAYAYPDGSTADYGLRAPGGKYYKLHKVRVCWDDETPRRRAAPGAAARAARAAAPPAPPAPPAESPAAPATPAPPAPRVLGAIAFKPSSKLTGPAGCAGRIVKATVSGRGIVKTTFRLDGRRVKTVAGPAPSRCARRLCARAFTASRRRVAARRRASAHARA